MSNGSNTYRDVFVTREDLERIYSETDHGRNHNQIPMALQQLREAAQKQAEITSHFIERLGPICRPIKAGARPEGVAAPDEDVVPLAKELIEAADMIRGNTELLAGALENLEL